MTILPEPCVHCGGELGDLWRVEHHSTVDVLHFVCRACFTPALDVQSAATRVVPQQPTRAAVPDLIAAH